MNFHSYKRSSRERGYVLLTLMLLVALLTIGLLAMVQNIESQIKRDREEEMIHRGVQYSRAVRRFFAKFRRYPASIEELESTNNIRFLRKRYKDPITGKDFKVLRLNDIASFQRAPGVAVAAASDLPPDADGGSSDAESGTDGTNPAADTPASKPMQKPGSAQADASQADPSSDAVETPSDPQATHREPQDPSKQFGVPIVGVTSFSKDKTIREFNKKDHYDQWQFIYNPSTDTGGIINTPDQPLLQRAAQVSEPANGPTPVPGVNQDQSNSGLAPGSR